MLRVAAASSHGFGVGSIVCRRWSDEGRSFRRSPTGPSVAPPRPLDRSACHRRCFAAAAGNPANGSLVGRDLRAAGFRRRHPRLPRPVAARRLGLLERPVYLAEPDIVVDRQCSISTAPGGGRRALFVKRHDRPRRRELVPRAAGRGPSRRRRRRLDVLARRRSGSGHHHGRNHPIARPGDRRRHRRCLGPRQTVLLRQRLRAGLCRAARPAIGVLGLAAGRPPVCHDQAGATTPSPKPSASPAWCWAT